MQIFPNIILSTNVMRNVIILFQNNQNVRPHIKDCSSTSPYWLHQANKLLQRLKRLTKCDMASTKELVPRCVIE